MAMTIGPSGVNMQLGNRVREYNAKVGSGDIPTDIQSLISSVLRESYMQMNEDLQFFAEKVRHFNGMKKAIREHTSELRNIMSKLAGVDDEGRIDGSSAPGGSTGGGVTPTTDPDGLPVLWTDANKGQRPPDIAGSIGQFTNYQMEGGRTDLEQLLMDNPGKLQELVGAVPYMTPSELKQVLLALGGTDMDLHGDIRHAFGEILGAASPYQILALDADAQVDNMGNFMGIPIPGDLRRGDFNDVFQGAIGGARAFAQAQTGSASSDSGALAQALANQVEAERADAIAAQQAAAAAAAEETADPNETTAPEGGYGTADGVDMDPSDGSIDAVMLANEEPFLRASGKKVTTKAELEAHIKEMEERLSSVGDDAQLANVDLQNSLQKQQQTLQLMSNVSKMMHDTAMAITRKIGG